MSLVMVTHLSSAPPPWMVLPFGLLLVCMAVLPLCAASFWERHFKKVSLLAGLGAAAWYALAAHDVRPVLASLEDYTGFMALTGSLFVITGGIHVKVGGESSPWKNAVFLLCGAALAPVIGTTGASMLLIRPWIALNKHRITSYHIVFFIFIVGNVGGSLTPAGNPPLYMGFLRGVGFWWTLGHLWPSWLAAVGLLTAVFYGIDRRCFRRLPPPLREKIRHDHERWQVRGLVHLVWLAVVLGVMFLPREWRIGTDLFAVPVSALVMLLAALASRRTASPQVRQATPFSLAPVEEVAWLFLGIFVSMRPALDLLEGGHALPLDSPLQFYLASGTLSACLDNAPTYLAFLAAAMGRHHMSVDDARQVAAFASAHGAYVVAVSMGANFFGAATYVGNGPNFMIKAVADRAGVRTPSFPGYVIRYTVPVLLPVLGLVGWWYLGR